MPSHFKALATITAWILWIAAGVMASSTLAMGIINGTLYGSEPPPLSILISFAVALAYGVGAVVVMILRKNME
jgi:hypothetical protein